jgi:hypothetical protein
LGCISRNGKEAAMQTPDHHETLAPKALKAAFAIVLAGLLTVPAYGPAQAQGDPILTVKQEPGKTVYWVLPGPRRLSEATFGTADNPKMTFAPRLKKAQQMAEEGKLPPTVPQLLQDMPVLVGVPEKARKKGPDGNLWLMQPTGFSDKARAVRGSFTSKLWDNVAEDPPGPPGKTDDKATMTAAFTDPQGNEYRVELDHVVKPPFPGYETGGGVVIDTKLHGTTGTGTPLMPEVDTIAAWWGVGDVYINGELKDKGRVMHLMTTKVVRKRDYSLATQDELPLAPEERFLAAQEHHTHLFVMPIKATEKGPVFEPAPSAFELPNGKMQPFMHIMFEQDTVARG